MSDAEAWKPGQDTQAVATARLQGQDPDKIHCPVWGVIGNLGDSICYAGVPPKVEAIQAELRRRVGQDFRIWPQLFFQFDEQPTAGKLL